MPPSLRLLAALSLCTLRVFGNPNIEQLLEETGSTRIAEDYIVQNLVNSSYDNRVRPYTVNEIGKSEPVEISVNIFLRSISNIDFVNMQFSLQLTFRESWLDRRLAFAHLGEDVPPYVVLSRRNDLIWMPDTFFPNEKQAHRHSIDAPNMLIRVYPDGRVLFSERISLVLSCPMYLEKYPMDVQSCHLDLASYAYTTDDLMYTWKTADPVQIRAGLMSSLPSFFLSNVSTASCSSITNTGKYSCLRTIFTLERQFSYYLLQVYIPSTLLVIVSWVSFWLDRTAVPARVTLGVTTLLSMTTQAAAVNAKLPPVSYVKAIDIWIAVCLSFIFGAVLEYAYVSYLASLLEQKKEKKEDCDVHGEEATRADTKTAANSPESEGLLSPKEETALRLRALPARWAVGFWERMRSGADSAKMIDVHSRLLFPLLFVVFNVFYWSRYSTI